MYFDKEKYDIVRLLIPYPLSTNFENLASDWQKIC